MKSIFGKRVYRVSTIYPDRLYDENDRLAKGFRAEIDHYYYSKILKSDIPPLCTVHLHTELKLLGYWKGSIYVKPLFNIF